MHFDKLYSLNYDLLAYWVRCRKNMAFKDGFGDQAYELGYDPTDPDDNYESYLEDYVFYNDNITDQNFMFLHGALHIFDHETDAIKLTFSRTNKTLKKQIFENLVRENYPIFISEGTHREKLEKIRHNYYLTRSYKSFKNQPGNLIIFGTALKSNDKHIADAIVFGKFTNIYAGVFSKDDEKMFLQLRERIEEQNKTLPGGSQKRLTLYDAKSINPWGRPAK